MDEATAVDVVERLRTRRVFASVNRRAGVYNVGIRVVIPDGREVIWDNDGAAGLEAMVLRDGVLVGYVPEIPDSADLDAARIADIIGNTDYDKSPEPEAARPTTPPPPPPSPPAVPPIGSSGSPPPPAVPSPGPPPAENVASAPGTAVPPPPAPSRLGWLGKFRRGRQG
jgi:hypothetical protein